MSFNFNFSQLQEQAQKLTSSLSENINNLKLQETTQNLSSNLTKEVGNLKPIFQRTTRSLQEKFGSIDDISELPQEYKDLEKKVDNLKIFD
ncbi:unnamed protein product [Ambrosiozyma monospora]|uniref:Unnamed protein product n=1 Tax=Ambrosiozyma monospora TaxID=43982 RepID=A0ACB5SU30_AMBMO|nr:unnamed protein product [Ambrosiozyma monospora]